ncbi:MAG: YceI family protein [Flavobacteriales bacterium]
MKTKQILYFLPFAVLLIFGFKSAVNNQQIYTVDTNKSAVKWKGYKEKKPDHQHIGTVKLSSGTVIIENGKLVGGAIEIDMNSMEEMSDNKGSAAKLIGHLKSSDFFNVNEFAKSSFTIIKVNNEVVTGNLTVLGKTKLIDTRLMASLSGDRVAVGGQFSVNLADFGVPYLNKKDDENLISPTVQFSVHIEAVKN